MAEAKESPKGKAFTTQAAERVVHLLNRADEIGGEVRDYVQEQIATNPRYVAARKRLAGLLGKRYESRADVAAKDIDRWTALHFAGYNGHWAAMRLLLEKGADVTAKDGRGEMPLLLAAATGHEVVVRLLLLYCREHGMAIYDEDMDVAAKLLAGPKSHMICDGCDARIADSDPHHHCSICNDDYFDLCQKCIDSGVLCPGNSHRLI